MIVNKDGMHTYFVCKLLKLHKLIKNALKRKCCKYRDMKMGETGRQRILYNLAIMYKGQLEKLFHPVGKDLKKKILSFVRHELLNDQKKSKDVTTSNELKASSASEILKSALERKSISLSTRTIRTVIRMNQNILRTMKRKVINTFYVKLKKYGKKALSPILLPTKKFANKQKQIESFMMEPEHRKNYQELLKLIELALKDKKHIYRAFDDSFPLHAIKRKGISMRSIIKKICSKKMIRSKVRRHKMTQKKSKAFTVKTVKASENIKDLENLLNNKGLTCVPKICLYAVYTYRKLLRNIERQNVDIMTKISTKRKTDYKKSSCYEKGTPKARRIPEDVLYAKRTFRKKAYKLIKRCLSHKERHYSDKKSKQNERKLRLCINKVLESRGFNPVHRSMVINLISKLIPVIKFIGKDRLHVKRLSVFIKMILMHKYFRLGSPNQQLSDPEIYTMDYIEAADNISIEDLNALIRHLRTYIFDRNAGLFLKGREKKSEKEKVLRSAYKIHDPDLKQFYKYALSITTIQPTARWKLRKLILQYGSKLKECCQIHYSTKQQKQKGNTYEVCTESERTDSLEKLFKSLRHAEKKKEGKHNRPLYRPEPEQPIKPTEENAPKNEPSEILEGKQMVSEVEIKDPVHPCFPIRRKSKDQVKPKSIKQTKPHAINVNKVYQFKKCLHRGEFTTVNSYYSQILKRDVAIKCISKMKLPIEIFKKYLPQTVSLIGQLNHPHVVKYYEAFENGAKLYLVMELAETGSLTNYIQNRGRLDQIIYHKFLAQIVDAVYYCFQMKIFHRKISCNNILITKANNIKLCDFSYAKGISNDIKLLETYCGVLAFTAPEILECNAYNPYLSEIWSIGVVTYAMVYGVLPFDSTNYANLMKQVKVKLQFKRYPDTPFAVINLMHNMIAPLNCRWDIITVMNDPWLFKQSIIKDNQEIQPPENVKPWKEIKEQIISLKGALEGTILKHIAEYATESEFRKIQKRSAKKKEYIPEKMKWLFEFY